MTSGLRVLLEGIIDYAGLFPPTALTMKDAVANFGRFQGGPESWFISRFVCPATRLEEFAAAVGPSDEPWPLTVLIPNFNKFEEEIALVEEFIAEYEDTAVIECVEIRANVPLDSRVLRPVSNIEVEEVFVEVPLGPHLLTDLTALAEEGQLGAKARTGGVTADLFPSVEPLAMFIQECVNLGLCFKMTAGLHHPYRQYHPSVKTDMHGFLNVLVAGALAMAADLSRSEIEDVLSEQRVGAFEFSDDGLRYNGLHATLDEIDEFRDLFRSIGSCSVEEPLQDLAAIGLITSKSRR
jgi:hypothetical protein